VLLRTDAVPGYEDVAPAGLLSVIVELTEDDAFVRPAEDGSGPMRCLSVRVNGTGDVMRWYFAKDGQPQAIDLSRGRHRQPAKYEEVDVAFGNDARLQPAR
jgi:hypothetical protein